MNRCACTPTFTAAPFTVRKKWKQPRHPVAEEWVKEEEHYPVTKKDETVPFVRTGMDLEGAVLSDMSQGDGPCDLPHSAARDTQTTE